MVWQTVIGIEVHTQLKTKSKLFSGSPTNYGAPSNTQTSYIDAGLPGVLPVLNEQAVNLAIRLGLSINATINDLSLFERKNYFYPDLPKGYQISQYQHPIVSNGYLTIHMPHQKEKHVEIIRAHLEEDAGKSLHENYDNLTGIDLNRAGTPLLEIVTSPCLYSIEEAITFLKTLHQHLRFLDISDGNMQEGSFRADINISLKQENDEQLGNRVELKNLNSFKFIEKAIRYEQERQQERLEEGKVIVQETRQYCPDRNITLPLRQKENENDYRYFPDPDLLPVPITQEKIDEIQSQLPKTPAIIEKELISNALINSEDRQYLLTSPEYYYYYLEVKKHCQIDDKAIINWLKGPYQALINELNIKFTPPPIEASQIGELLTLLNNKAITSTQARSLFKLMASDKRPIKVLIEQSGFNQSASEEIFLAAIEQLIEQYPTQVNAYREGKEKILGFFVGLLMKQFKGQGNPALLNDTLQKKLNENKPTEPS